LLSLPNAIAWRGTRVPEQPSDERCVAYRGAVVSAFGAASLMREAMRSASSM